MALMKAVQVNSPGGKFELVRKEVPEPKENEVLIKVAACGICHGDSVTKEGHFPGIVYPRIPGHEVVGVIEKAGPRVLKWKPGQRVGVGWHAGHCYHCDACRKGDFRSCESFLITGISTDGGYAEYMTARSEALVGIPEELDSVDAAPLLCAGRTTFGALKDSIAQGGDLVAVHGLGGLGHLAVQYAVKLGLKTVVLSRGLEKEKLAHKLGAHTYLDTTSTDVVKELNKMGGARVILCTAPNSKTISDLAGGLRRNGQLIIITFAPEPIQISPAVLLRGGRSICGYVGGDIEEAVQFSVLWKVVPMVEIFRLEEAKAAYEKMMSSKVHFRAVLKMSN